jgi:hypothetical protein
MHLAQLEPRPDRLSEDQTRSPRATAATTLGLDPADSDEHAPLIAA